MSNNLRLIKSMYNYFTDADGNIITEPTKGEMLIKLPKENKVFIARLLKLCLTTRLLNDTSKIYIKSPHSAVRTVFAIYNIENPDKTININTAISKINYDRVKLNKYFDEDMMEMLTYTSLKGAGRLPHYEEQLSVVMKAYSKVNIFDDGLIIKLDKLNSAKQVNNKDIQLFLDAIAPYRSKNIDLIKKTINNTFGDVIGYLNYLSELDERTPEEDRIYNTVRKFLDCEPVESLDDEEAVTFDLE